MTITIVKKIPYVEHYINFQKHNGPANIIKIKKNIFMQSNIYDKLVSKIFTVTN